MFTSDRQNKSDQKEHICPRSVSARIPGLPRRRVPVTVRPTMATRSVLTACFHHNTFLRQNHRPETKCDGAPPTRPEVPTHLVDPEVKCLESLENSVADSSYPIHVCRCEGDHVRVGDNLVGCQSQSQTVGGGSGKMPSLAGDPFVSQQTSVPFWLVLYAFFSISNHLILSFAACIHVTFFKSLPLISSASSGLRN